MANKTAFDGRTMVLVVVLLIVAVALAGCGRSGNPAPVDYRTASAGAPGGIYTVQRGDTVYGISQKFNVSLRSVIDANNLRPPYLLQIGQKLRIPSPPVHVVRRGDTAYGISRQYGVDLHEMVSLNGMRPPYTLYVGQRVRLPGSAASRQVASTRSSESKRGSSTDAAPAKRSKRVAAVPQPPPRSAGRFMWPARGRVISRFGSKDDGLHNDGINIAAPRGTPIEAAENGVVAYVGNELRGFGNLVLLKHADGYITAYAHADRNSR